MEKSYYHCINFIGNIKSQLNSQMSIMQKIT